MLMRQLQAELAVRKDLKAVRQLLLHLETAEIGACIAERPSDRAAGRMAIRRTAGSGAPRPPSSLRHTHCHHSAPAHRVGAYASVATKDIYS